MKGKLLKAMDTAVERWKLFPFVSYYFKEHGWVYEGWGRWTRRDALLWVKQTAAEYVAELWDMALFPRLVTRRSLNDVNGLNLLFAE